MLIFPPPTKISKLHAQEIWAMCTYLSAFLNISYQTFQC